MYKQQVYQIAAVAEASAEVDAAASEAFTNVLRLSPNRSPQYQAPRLTALVYVTVNNFVFSEGGSVQNIRRVNLDHTTQAELLE